MHNLGPILVSLLTLSKTQLIAENNILFQPKMRLNSLCFKFPWKRYELYGIIYIWNPFPGIVASLLNIIPFETSL